MKLNRSNSIEQEYQAFSVEAKVWNALKGDETDAQCDSVSWLIGREGEEEEAKIQIRRGGMQRKTYPKTHEKHTMNSLTSLTFHSTPSIPFTFRYPVGWQTREIVRDEDVEVFIAGPRNEADTYSVTLTIRLRPEPFLTPGCRR